MDEMKNEIIIIKEKLNNRSNEEKLLYENKIQQQEIERLNKIIQGQNEAFIKGQNDQNSRNVLIDGHENAGLTMTELQRNYDFIEVQDFDSQYSLREQNMRNNIFKSNSVSIYDGEIND